MAAKEKRTDQRLVGQDKPWNGVFGQLLAEEHSRSSRQFMQIATFYPTRDSLPQGKKGNEILKRNLLEVRFDVFLLVV